MEKTGLSCKELKDERLAAKIIWKFQCSNCNDKNENNKIWNLLKPSKETMIQKFEPQPGFLGKETCKSVKIVLEGSGL